MTSAGGEIQRGTGGLGTALIGLASYRGVDLGGLGDDRTGRPSPPSTTRAVPFLVHTPDGGDYRVKLVASDPTPRPLYNIIANPMPRFIQHYLGTCPNAPDIRRHETEAFEFGYNAVNEDLAGRAR